jgi:ACT domain-containing protein
MRAVVSVVGKDRVGILADVSIKCKDYNANIYDVSQTVLQDFFTMIMLVELKSENFLNFVDYLQDYGKENNLKIHVMHEDIFNAMHTV